MAPLKRVQSIGKTLSASAVFIAAKTKIDKQKQIKEKFENIMITALGLMDDLAELSANVDELFSPETIDLTETPDTPLSTPAKTPVTKNPYRSTVATFPAPPSPPYPDRTPPTPFNMEEFFDSDTKTGV